MAGSESKGEIWKREICQTRFSKFHLGLAPAKQSLNGGSGSCNVKERLHDRKRLN